MSEVLEKYFNPESIQLAYYRVKCWTDKMVKDQVGIKAFSLNLESNSHTLSKKIIQGEFIPQRGFKFYVPKASKTLRTKTMLFIEDAIVYQAIANRMAELNYQKLNQFESFVFGSVLSPDVEKGVNLLQEKDPNFFFFRFWKSLYQKFKDSVIECIEADKVKFKFETDITGFFDSIPHYNLLEILSERFGVEDEILDILSNCLNIWSGTREKMTPGVGIPQGTAPSFLLANMLLHDLDEGLISDAFKYYRYMDDINIYGYSEFDLLKALLIIDKYTKGCGLSINAKKTSIEEIKEGNDSKIKELKKVDFFSLIEEDYEELEIEDSQKQQDQEKKLKKKAARLSEQDGDSWEDEYGSQTIILKNEKEIKKFWTQNIERVRKELPKLFLNPKASIANLKLNEDVDDLDFIKLSTIYGTSIKAMKEWGVIIKPHNDLLNYWLFAYKKFFWRANNLNHTLLLYQNNSELKNHLTNLLTTDFELFEWVRYFVIMNLSLAHSFTDRELRQVYFKLLKAEESDLARISYYRLLFKHSCNKQFTDTITRELHKETNPYLKMLIADFNKNHLSEGITIENFLNSIGL